MGGLLPRSRLADRELRRHGRTDCDPQGTPCRPRPSCRRPTIIISKMTPSMPAWRARSPRAAGQHHCHQRADRAAHQQRGQRDGPSRQATRRYQFLLYHQLFLPSDPSRRTRHAVRDLLLDGRARRRLAAPDRCRSRRSASMPPWSKEGIWLDKPGQRVGDEDHRQRRPAARAGDRVGHVGRPGFRVRVPDQAAGVPDRGAGSSRSWATPAIAPMWCRHSSIGASARLPLWRAKFNIPFPTFVSSRSTAFTNVGNKGSPANHDPSAALHLTFL